MHDCTAACTVSLHHRTAASLLHHCCITASLVQCSCAPPQHRCTGAYRRTAVPVSLCHCITVSPHDCITALLLHVPCMLTRRCVPPYRRIAVPVSLHHFATNCSTTVVPLLSCCTTASLHALHQHVIVLLHHSCTTVPVPHYSLTACAASTRHCIAAPLHICIAAPLHQCTSALLDCCTSATGASPECIGADASKWRQSRGIQRLK